MDLVLEAVCVSGLWLAGRNDLDEDIALLWESEKFDNVARGVGGRRRHCPLRCVRGEKSSRKAVDINQPTQIISSNAGDVVCRQLDATHTIIVVWNEKEGFIAIQCNTENLIKCSVCADAI